LSKVARTRWQLSILLMPKTGFRLCRPTGGPGNGPRIESSRTREKRWQTKDALREGRRAIELLPVTKDSINGAHMIEFFAIIAAWVGEKDLACEQLAIATRLPGSLSYGQLKLHPYPLRVDPRFEKIVQSLAPK